jgi:hypothetical protein
MEDEMGGEVACMGDIQNAYKIFVSTSERKKATFITQARMGV